STRSQPKSPSERTPLSSLIRPDGMALKPWWFRTTSHSCRCRRAHPNSTARKTSGSSCVRIGCQTGFSNPSTISSTTAATLGTHSSTNPGRLCPSRDATGQQSITQSEDWYNIAHAPSPPTPSHLHPMYLPLSGLLVVSLEQAVAAPVCTCRLADAGARVIKVERPEGDFARYYDKLAVPRAAMAATLAATTSEPAAPSSPLPLAGEGQGGGMQKGSRVQAHPLPNPPPQAGEGMHRASGEEEKGQSAYLGWLKRGKESLVLDLARADDKALLAAILAKADVFVQNLKPGAVAKLGFPLAELRRAHPRLVICSISGYGDDGPYAA